MKHARRWLPTLCVCTALAWPCVALAGPALDAARAAYENGDFGSAVARLQELEQDPGLSVDERRAIGHAAMCR